MAVNRFSQIAAPARFSPLSFEELSLAPLTLRQREDDLLNQRDTILSELNNIEVADIYQGQVDKERGKFTEDLNSLAEKIQTEGAGNLNYLNDFRNLRNRYNKAVSNTGNIGRAAGVKTQLDAAKAEYLNHAVNVQGQSSQSAQRNWEIDKEAYIKRLPTDLSKHAGSLPEFTPNSAPKYTDVVEQMERLTKLAANVNIKDLQGTFYFQELNDGSIIVADKTTGHETNHPGLIALQKELNRTLFDPHSPLNKHLRYNEMDPKDLIPQIDNLIQMRAYEATTDVDTYKGQLEGSKNAPGGGSGVPYGNVGADPLSTGRVIINETNTSGSIAGTIKSVQRDDTLTDEQKNRKINYLQQAAVARKDMENKKGFQDRVPELNKSIAESNELKSRGVSSFEDYNNWTPNDELAFRLRNLPTGQFNSMSREEIKNILNENEDTPAKVGRAKEISDFLNSQAPTGVWGRGNARIAQPRTMKESFLNTFENITKDVSSVYGEITKDLLEPSNVYMFDTNPDTTKFLKGINEGVSLSYDFTALDANGILNVANQDGTYDIVQWGSPNANYTQTKVGERHKAVKDVIDSAETVNWEITGIDDGGLSRNAGLMFDIKTKNGDAKNTFKVVIDLNDKTMPDLIQKFTSKNGEYYQQFDKELQSTMDFIRNKINYSDMVVDAKEVGKNNNIFDDAGNNSILANLDQSFREDNIVLNQKEPMAEEMLFATPKSTDKQLAVVLNQDGYYSMHKKNTTTGTEDTFKFKDLANKAAYGRAVNETNLSGLEDTEIKGQYLTWGKANILHNLRNSAGDLTKEVDRTITYNPNKKYLEALREYDDLYRRNNETQINTWEFKEAAARIFDKISDLDVYTKDFKVIL